MRFLTLAEVLGLHSDLIATSGGASGVRDLGRVASAVAQPMATYDGKELYPSIHEKAAAIGFALIQGHPFVDGNKRIGHAATEVFLVLNGYEISASTDDQEQVILAIARGEMSREAFSQWLRSNTVLLHP